MTISEGRGKTEKVLMWFAMGALVLLGVVLAQPIWNSNKMIAQITQDCKAVRGVLIVDHGMFGDTYSCQPYMDRGIKQ